MFEFCRGLVHAHSWRGEARFCPSRAITCILRSRNVGTHRGDGHCSHHEGTLTPCSDSVHYFLAGAWKALQLDVSQGVGREEPVLGFLRDFCLLFFSPLHIWAWWLYLWWKKLFQLQVFGLAADCTRIKGVGECETACRFPTGREDPCLWKERSS